MIQKAENLRHNLSLYVRVGVSEIQAAQMYRVNFFFSLVCDFVPLLGPLYLWVSLLPGEKIYGYTRVELIWYYLLSALLSSWLPTIWSEVGDGIRQGKLSTYLIRPISYYWNYFALQLGSNLVYCGMGVLVLAPFAVGAIMATETPAISRQIGSWLAFFGMLSLGFALHFTMGFCIQLLSFWTDRVKGITALWGLLSAIAGGAFFPLDFLPPSWLAFIRCLPFYYTRFLPLQTALGTARGSDILCGLLSLALWTGVFWVIYRLMWTYGVKHYSAPGG